MESRLARFGYGFMTVTAVLVAVWSLRYVGALFDVWVAIDTSLRGLVARIPLSALTHMLIAPIALFVGPLQFLPKLRAKHPKLHRYAGRIYVVACTIAGIGALAVVPHALGGPVAGVGFGMLAVAWLGTTLGGWWAAVRRKLALHRLLMRLSYAMTFGAVTLRLQIPLGFMLGYHSYAEMSVWLAYTAWIPNVIVVLDYSALEHVRHADRTTVGRARTRTLSAHPTSPSLQLPRVEPTAHVG